MEKKTKKQLATEFLRKLQGVGDAEFRALLVANLDKDVLLAVNEYAATVAKRWAAGFKGMDEDARTLIVIGYLLRANEEHWKENTKPSSLS